MSQSVDRTISRVIEAMYAWVGEELTVDDLARTAAYSKFHFTRLFGQITGVSPGRFLATLRFQEAKRLLATTSLSVAEISNQVGYSSLGTFSTRFKRLVGVTPTGYRRLAGQPAGWLRTECAQASRVSTADYRHRPDGTPGAVWGQVYGPTMVPSGLTFIGLFPDSIADGLPVRCTILTDLGRYQLSDVPAGTWHLLAQGVLLEPGQECGRPTGISAGTVGLSGPIVVGNGGDSTRADLLLRAMRTVDLPLLCTPFTARPRDLAWPDSAGRHGEPSLRQTAKHLGNLGDAKRAEVLEHGSDGSGRLHGTYRGRWAGDIGVRRPPEER